MLNTLVLNTAGSPAVLPGTEIALVVLFTNGLWDQRVVTLLQKHVNMLALGAHILKKKIVKMRQEDHVLKPSMGNLARSYLKFLKRK